MNEIREKLFEKQDLKYKEFHGKLCPNLDKIIGVRVPELKKIAKQIAKTDYKNYLKNAQDEYYEELLLQGLVIGYSKTTLEEKLKYLEKFVPKINSWAVCDVTCGTLKIAQKYEKEVWEFLQQYINSKKEYEIRFALVMYLDYYLKEEYIDKILEQINNITSKDYYVQMAIAWLVSIAYIKQKEKTEKFLKNNKLDKFTQNKSISKICESYRITPEEKERVKKYKI